MEQEAAKSSEAYIWAKMLQDSQHEMNGNVNRLNSAGSRGSTLPVRHSSAGSRVSNGRMVDPDEEESQSSRKSVVRIQEHRNQRSFIMQPSNNIWSAIENEGDSSNQVNAIGNSRDMDSSWEEGKNNQVHFNETHGGGGSDAWMNLPPSGVEHFPKPPEGKPTSRGRKPI